MLRDGPGEPDSGVASFGPSNEPYYHQDHCSARAAGVGSRPIVSMGQRQIKESCLLCLAQFRLLTPFLLSESGHVVEPIISLTSSAFIQIVVICQRPFGKIFCSSMLTYWQICKVHISSLASLGHCRRSRGKVRGQTFAVYWGWVDLIFDLAYSRQTIAHKDARGSQSRVLLQTLSTCPSPYPGPGWTCSCGVGS